MIEIIPYLMVPVAFWMHKDHSSNLAAIGAFIIIYSFSLAAHNILVKNEFIFILDIIFAASLSSIIKATCRKPSILIVLMLLTCFGFTILNSIAFIAYNYYQDTIYQASIYAMSIVVGLQWAAIWIKDDGIINGTGFHNHILRRLLDRTGAVLYRSKIHSTQEIRK